MDLYLQNILKILRSENRVAKLKELDSPVLRDLLYLAYSPSVVLDLPSPDFETQSQFNTSPDVYKFHRVFAMLVDTINCPPDLRYVLQKHLLLYPIPQRKVLYKFLTRELLPGLTVDDINKALPYCIPAIHITPIAEYTPGQLRYPIYCVPLYDGVRLIAIKYINNICFYDNFGSIFEISSDIRKKFQPLNSGIYDIILTDTQELHLFNYTRLNETKESKLSSKEKAEVLSNLDLEAPLFSHSVFKIKTTSAIRKYYKYYKNKGAAGLFLMGRDPFNINSTSVFILDSLYHGGR